MDGSRGSLLLANMQVTAADEEEGRAASFLEICAVFTMTFGPGCAVATYTTLFGWYQRELHSSEALVWMRMALFAPFPVIKILQQRYDAYFDSKFTIRLAFFFRVVFMQLVVALLMIVWMVLPTTVAGLAPIIGFGVILGACCAPFMGSSMQIAVGFAPVLSVFTQLGYIVGMSVPAIAVYVANFSSSSSHAEMCKIVAVPMTISILAFVWLGCLHYADVFEPAFLAITSRRDASKQEEEKEIDVNDSADEGAEELQIQRTNQSGASSSSVAQAEPSDGQNANASVDQEGTPRWVWVWFGLQSIGVGADFFLLTLIGYFGDAQLTLHLATMTLLSAPVGRVMALLWSRLPLFKQGPMHISGAVVFSIRMALWIVLLLRLAKVWTPPSDTVLAIWGTWMVLGNLHISITDIGVLANLPGSKKEKAIQYGLIVVYSALFIGLATASALVIAFEQGICDDIPQVCKFL